MQKKVEVVFYIKSLKTILIDDEKQEDGYVQCRIYNGLRYGTFLQGCGGQLITIKLSDNRIIKTNDLWIMNDRWSKTIPDTVLEGTIIKDSYKDFTSYIY